MWQWIYIKMEAGAISIRLRLFNSQALLEGTNLVLFNINEGVLVFTCANFLCSCTLHSLF